MGATMEGHLLLAMVLSGAALALIFVLDHVEDTAHEMWGSEHTRRISKVVQIVVNALSILIGFTWEQSFDGGVEAVASTTSRPLLMKLCLISMVAVVIVPAWRRHILVKVLSLNRLRDERLKALGECDEESEPLTCRDED